MFYKNNQVDLPELLSVHGLYGASHVVLRVSRAVIVTDRKLMDVAVKVVAAYILVDSDVSPFQPCPE